MRITAELLFNVGHEFSCCLNFFSKYPNGVEFPNNDPSINDEVASYAMMIRYEIDRALRTTPKYEQHLKESMILVLSNELGLGFDLLHRIYLHRLEDGRYRILGDEEYCTHIPEEIYENPRTAVERFMEIRKQYQIGFDFEVESE